MVIKKYILAAGLGSLAVLTGFIRVAAQPPAGAHPPHQAGRSASPAPPVAGKALPVIYDPAALPLPVRRMREKILAAARTGTIEALRPLLARSENVLVQPVSIEEDPITFLKELSGDGDGVEILAILIDLLNAGCVHLGAGSTQEVYVWPYFVAVAPDKLTRKQLVEAYRIMTASDLETLKEVGSYIYFRVGISPDGKWRFFVTGDQSDIQPH